MGRKKGDGSKRGGGAAAPPRQTLEGLSDDQRYSLVEQHRQKYERALAMKKAADKALKDVGKIIKADLGAEGMAEIKAVIEAQTPEGVAAIKARVEQAMRVLRWMNEPVGTIHDMFPDSDDRPLADRAFAEGKRQGLAGESPSNPHHVSTEAHRAFNSGYAEGQKTLATKGFKPLTPEEKTDIQASASLGTSRPTFEVVN